MSEKKSAIKLDNVSKRFNVYSKNIERIKGVMFGREPAEIKYALNEVSLEIADGERVALMGVVDSGRSTLAKIIAGITGPSSGKVRVRGRKNVMIDAKAGMDMEFTCRENIFCRANAVGISRKDIEPHVDEILQFAEIESFADLPMKRAPKGSPALVSLEVGLNVETDVLVIDDMFGGGGNYVAEKCMERVEKYLDENRDVTALLISNRPKYIRKAADRVIVIDNGTIIHDGDIEEGIRIFKKCNSRK
ncbi:MAG: ATP-binding cassette domain-containing protein [Clostridia bacterium]|nr:ATP-binding cassette domain-containing protein [Clostridia bacterium]